MTIYECPNIEHCDIETIANTLYRIRTHEGWYIHKANDLPGGTEEEPTIVYKTVAIVPMTYDFSEMEIVAEADLPPNAEICGGEGNEHEVM